MIVLNIKVLALYRSRKYLATIQHNNTIYINFPKNAHILFEKNSNLLKYQKLWNSFATYCVTFTIIPPSQCLLYGNQL